MRPPARLALRSIVVDGVPCVSAAAAARACSLHPDYIARLSGAASSAATCSAVSGILIRRRSIAFSQPLPFAERSAGRRSKITAAASASSAAFSPSLQIHPLTRRHDPAIFHNGGHHHGWNGDRRCARSISASLTRSDRPVTIFRRPTRSRNVEDLAFIWRARNPVPLTARANRMALHR